MAIVSRSELPIADPSVWCVASGCVTGCNYALNTVHAASPVKHAANSRCRCVVQDSGNVAATGAKLIASASKGHLVVHDVMIKTAELLMLAKVCPGLGQLGLESPLEQAKILVTRQPFADSSRDGVRLRLGLSKWYLNSSIA